MMKLCRVRAYILLAVCVLTSAQEVQAQARPKGSFVLDATVTPIRTGATIDRAKVDATVVARLKSRPAPDWEIGRLYLHGVQVNTGHSTGPGTYGKAIGQKPTGLLKAKTTANLVRRNASGLLIGRDVAVEIEVDAFQSGQGTSGAATVVSETVPAWPAARTAKVTGLHAWISVTAVQIEYQNNSMTKNIVMDVFTTTGGVKTKVGQAAVGPPDSSGFRTVYYNHPAVPEDTVTVEIRDAGGSSGGSTGNSPPLP